LNDGRKKKYVEMFGSFTESFNCMTSEGWITEQLCQGVCYTDDRMTHALTTAQWCITSHTRHCVWCRCHQAANHATEWVCFYVRWSWLQTSCSVSC